MGNESTDDKCAGMSLQARCDNGKPCECTSGVCNDKRSYKHSWHWVNGAKSNKVQCAHCGEIKENGK